MVIKSSSPLPILAWEHDIVWVENNANASDLAKEVEIGKAMPIAWGNAVADVRIMVCMM